MFEPDVSFVGSVAFCVNRQAMKYLAPNARKQAKTKKKISYKDLIVLSKEIHFNLFNVCCSFEPHFLSRNLSVEVQCRTSVAFFF